MSVVRSGGNGVGGVFWATYLAWLASEAVIWAGDRGADGGQDADRGTRRLIVLGVAGGLAAAFVAAARARSFAIPAPEARVAGVVMMWAGVGLRQWAVRTLGAFFRTRVTLAAEHRLVRAGPYRLLRHPAYTGALLTCVGVGLALGNWLSLAVMTAAPGAALAFRLRHEERVLRERFGAAWDEHRRGTWALVPPLW